MFSFSFITSKGVLMDYTEYVKDETCIDYIKGYRRKPVSLPPLNCSCGSVY